MERRYNPPPIMINRIETSPHRNFQFQQVMSPTFRSPLKASSANVILSNPPQTLQQQSTLTSIPTSPVRTVMHKTSIQIEHKDTVNRHISMFKRLTMVAVNHHWTEEKVNQEWNNLHSVINNPMHAEKYLMKIETRNCSRRPKSATIAKSVNLQQETVKPLQRYASYNQIYIAPLKKPKRKLKHTLAKSHCNIPKAIEPTEYLKLAEQIQAQMKQFQQILKR